MAPRNVVVGVPIRYSASPDVALWSEVQVGDGNSTDRRRIVTPPDGQYPNSAGMTLRVNGVLNRVDDSGPRAGSVFNFYPAPSLTVGTTLSAAWIDEFGAARSYTYVVPAISGEAPAALGRISITGPAEGPIEPGVFPANWNSVGPTGPFTKFFTGGQNIDQAWLNSNNGGSLLLENVSFAGRVNVRVNNLTIRNFTQTTGNTSYGFFTEAFDGSISGTVLEDGEVLQSQNSFVIRNTTVRRCRMRNSTADGFKLFGMNCIIEDCYITDMGNRSNPTAHADGLQIRSGSNAQIRRCNFEMPKQQETFINSICVIIQAADGNINNVLMEDCRFNGGGYSVTLTQQGSYQFTNLTVRNCVWGRDHMFGPTNMSSISGMGYVWTNNRYEDNGELIVR